MKTPDYDRAAAQLDQMAGAPDGVVLQKASSYEVRAIQWLWEEFLALGKLHLIAGAPGTGKTTLAMLMAAIVSARLKWPDGKRGEACDVLVYTAEDDPADTLIPRLMAMGADLERVHFIQATQVDGKRLPFDPSRDIPELELTARTLPRLGLVVVDPIVASVSRDGNSNNDVRRGLQPLVDMAQALNAAVIGITHLSKGTAGRDPTERVNGSIAYAALARVVMLAAKIKGPDGEERRVLVRSKSNIGPDGGGFEYSLQQVEAKPGVMASIATWGAPIEGNARDLLAEPPEEDAEFKTVTEEASESLARILGRDTVPSASATAQMRAEGFSPKIIRVARERLGVLVKRAGFGKEMASYWKLPDDAVAPSEPIRAPSCPPFTEGANGHEWENRARMGPSEAL